MTSLGVIISDKAPTEPMKTSHSLVINMISKHIFMRKKQLSAPLKQNVKIQKLSLSLYNCYH